MQCMARPKKQGADPRNRVEWGRKPQHTTPVQAGSAGVDIVVQCPSVPASQCIPARAGESLSGTRNTHTGAAKERTRREIRKQATLKTTD
jgi:hypothetical protein